MSRGELVTVVIPALNEQSFIADCLDSVRQQDYEPVQIVVVDGGSTDATVPLVEERMAADSRIELVVNTRQNIPSSLNLGLSQARGKWLVRVDAHSTVPRGYVSAAVARLEEGLWGGVGGRKDGIGSTSAGRAIAAAMGSRFGVGNSTYHHGTTVQEVDHLPFGAYPVALVRSMGGWNENLSANEDFEFDYRLRLSGMRLLFDPGMTIDWHCRQSIGDLFRQYLRYGRGKLDVARLHPESMRIRHIAPPAFVAYLVLTAAVSPWHPKWSLRMLAPYVAGLTVASVQTAPQLATTPDRLRVPLAFAAMHLGWGAGFWAGVGDVVGATVRRSR